VATRIILLAAAVAFAAPLGAAPVMAQGNSSNTTGSFDNSGYRMDHKKAEGGDTSQHGGHHHAATARAHGATHGKMATKSVPTGSESTNQLNDMSLASAKQGQSFAPSPAAAPDATKKKM
jgi:hypothetical protein